LGRDDWSTAREHLVKLGNAESLSAVDDALFCIALDSVPSNLPEQAMQFLAGDARSRWFDKSFTVVISGDSGMTINYDAVFYMTYSFLYQKFENMVIFRSRNLYSVIVAQESRIIRKFFILNFLIKKGRNRQCKSCIFIGMSCNY